MEIQSDAFHAVKAEGERHSLRIKELRLSDAGSYCVTAANPAGRASCGATLRIQSGETGAYGGRVFLHKGVYLNFLTRLAYLQSQDTEVHHKRCSTNKVTHAGTLFNPPPALLRLTFCLNDYKGLLELSIPTGGSLQP